MEVIRVENLANYQGKADALPEYTILPGPNEVQVPESAHIAGPPAYPPTATGGFHDRLANAQARQGWEEMQLGETPWDRQVIRAQVERHRRKSRRCKILDGLCARIMLLVATALVVAVVIGVIAAVRSSQQDKSDHDKADKEGIACTMSEGYSLECGSIGYLQPSQYRAGFWESGSGAQFICIEDDGEKWKCWKMKCDDDVCKIRKFDK